MKPLSEKVIKALEARGFKRWTKGDYDRLYINAEALGLECEYYKTGNISSSIFNGKRISHSQAYRLKAAKTYVDIKAGKLLGTSPILKGIAQEIFDGVLKDEEAVE